MAGASIAMRARRRRLPPEQLEEEGKGVEHGAGGLHAQQHGGVALGEGVGVLSALLAHPPLPGGAIEYLCGTTISSNKIKAQPPKIRQAKWQAASERGNMMPPMMTMNLAVR